MKAKKIEKRIVFIFKKNPFNNLSKEQMQKVKGGISDATNGGGASTQPGCVEDKPTVGTISF